MECPLCSEKHSDLTRHLANAHEFELEARLGNPSDPVILDLASKGIVYQAPKWIRVPL